MGFSLQCEKGRVAIWESAGIILSPILLGRGWRGQDNFESRGRYSEVGPKRPS
jgi:hypothetical protein